MTKPTEHTMRKINEWAEKEASLVTETNDKNNPLWQSAYNSLRQILLNGGPVLWASIGGKQ